MDVVPDESPEAEQLIQFKHKHIRRKKSAGNLNGNDSAQMCKTNLEYNYRAKKVYIGWHFNRINKFNMLTSFIVMKQG